MPVDDPYGQADQPTAVAGAGEGASGEVVFLGIEEGEEDQR